MRQMRQDIVEVLISAERIRQRVAEMGKEITAAYRDSLPLLVGMLKGSTLFVADLVRQIDLPLEMDFMAVEGYVGAQQSGNAVHITKDLDSPIEGRDVLLVEGIVDTGMTIGYVLRNLEVRQPRSIRLCTLLDKPARRILKVPISFRGFAIEDKFVVGYGLDFQQHYRNLPYIGVLSDAVTGLRKADDWP